MPSPSNVKQEDWIVRTQIETGELPTMDTHFAAWFFRTYSWPAIYADEGGEG